MVHELKKDLDYLHGLKEFKEFKKNNTDSYLCAAFMIVEPDKKTKWQIDYYSPGTDKMTTFSLEPKFENKESDTIHMGSDRIYELNLDNVDIGFDASLNIVTNLKNKNYSSEKISKIIMILQNINSKEIWNITYLTGSFKVLNVHIDAQSGDIIKEKLDNILSFNAQ